MEIPIEQVRREVELLAELLRQVRDTQIALGWVAGVVGQSPITVNIQGVASRPGIGGSRLDSIISEHPENAAGADQGSGCSAGHRLRSDLARRAGRRGPNVPLGTLRDHGWRARHERCPDQRRRLTDARARGSDRMSR